jgi:hypothetical protein
LGIPPIPCPYPALIHQQHARASAAQPAAFVAPRCLSPSQTPSTSKYGPLHEDRSCLRAAGACTLFAKQAAEAPRTFPTHRVTASSSLVHAASRIFLTSLSILHVDFPRKFQALVLCFLFASNTPFARRGCAALSRFTPDVLFW